MFTRFELLNVAAVVLWNDPIPADVIDHMKKEGWKRWSPDGVPLLSRRNVETIHELIEPYRDLVSELGAEVWAKYMIERIITDVHDPFLAFGGPDMLGLRCAIVHLKWLGEDQLRDEENARVAMAEAA